MNLGKQQAETLLNILAPLYSSLSTDERELIKSMLEAFPDLIEKFMLCSR